MRNLLQPELGPERTQTIVKEALLNLVGLLPQFPDVGRETNWDSRFIPIAGWYVALYAPMKANDKTAEDVGKIVYELNKIGLEAILKQKAF